jgi:hypothetical protein
MNEELRNDLLATVDFESAFYSIVHAFQIKNQQ